MSIELPLIFLAGLLGSAHCVGMCGPFILAISSAEGGRANGLLHQGFYFLGKTLTYTLLGAVVGALGAVLTDGFSAMQRTLSIVAGTMMLVIGLGLIGVTRRFESSGWLMRWPVFRQAMRYFLRQRTPGGTFGLGLLNGLLPCGLVYGLLVRAAATGTLLDGALTMFVFGIATVPALFALGVVGHLARPVWRARLNLAGGLVVVILGLITIVRGTPVMDAWRHDPHGAGPEPHQELHDAHSPEAGL